ncbi:histidine phosphatase family protein [Streptomyces sp. JNUCC 63]
MASLPAHSSAMRSPSSGSALTAAVLGLKAAVEPALRDLDYGTWRGRTVADIAAADPYGYSAWLTDPDAAPHGGETVRELCRRVAHWLSALPPDTGRALAQRPAPRHGPRAGHRRTSRDAGTTRPCFVRTGPSLLDTPGTASVHRLLDVARWRLECPAG